MRWLAVSVAAVTIFLLLCQPVECKKTKHYKNNPWASKEKASVFANTFINTAKSSDAFSQDQKDSIEAIGATIMYAMEQVDTSKKNAKATYQSLDMALASAIAEIIANGDNIKLQTTVAMDAMAEAFKKTTGKVNKMYIQDIKELIEMFANSKLESGEDEYDYDEDEESNVIDVLQVKPKVSKPTIQQTSSSAASSVQASTEQFMGAEVIASSSSSSSAQTSLASASSSSTQISTSSSATSTSQISSASTSSSSQVISTSSSSTSAQELSAFPEMFYEPPSAPVEQPGLSAEDITRFASALSSALASYDLFSSLLNTDTNTEDAQMYTNDMMETAGNLVGLYGSYISDLQDAVNQANIDAGSEVDTDTYANNIAVTLATSMTKSQISLDWYDPNYIATNLVLALEKYRPQEINEIPDETEVSGISSSIASADTQIGEEGVPESEPDAMDTAPAEDITPEPQPVVQATSSASASSSAQIVLTPGTPQEQAPAAPDYDKINSDFAQALTSVFVSSDLFSTLFSGDTAVSDAQNYASAMAQAAAMLLGSDDATTSGLTDAGSQGIADVGTGAGTYAYARSIAYSTVSFLARGQISFSSYDANTFGATMLSALARFKPQEPQPVVQATSSASASSSAQIVLTPGTPQEQAPAAPDYDKINSDFAQALTSVFVSSDLFSTLFSGDTAVSDAQNYASAMAQAAGMFMGIDSSSSGLIQSVSQSVMNLNANNVLNDFAQSIAYSTVSSLSGSQISLTNYDVNSFGAAMLSALEKFRPRSPAIPEVPSVPDITTIPPVTVMAASSASASAATSISFPSSPVTSPVADEFMVQPAESIRPDSMPSSVCENLVGRSGGATSSPVYTNSALSFITPSVPLSSSASLRICNFATAIKSSLSSASGFSYSSFANALNSLSSSITSVSFGSSSSNLVIQFLFETVVSLVQVLLGVEASTDDTVSTLLAVISKILV